MLHDHVRVIKRVSTKAGMAIGIVAGSHCQRLQDCADAIGRFVAQRVVLGR